MEKIKDQRAHLIVEPNGPLHGTVNVVGAKNAVLVIMASLILTRGVSTLRNVPCSQDVLHMIALLEQLGAYITFDRNNHVLPGGCIIGVRPIDYHLKNFQKMGVVCIQEGSVVKAYANNIVSGTYVLEYPSVGATENILMAVVCASGQTVIVNAALEPEVEDLISELSKMGAKIEVSAPATLVIDGVDKLYPVVHDIIPDRLEAGAFLLAAAISGGEVTVRNTRPDTLAVFLLKLEEMGHTITTNHIGRSITLSATKNPVAVSFKTGPYPGFPTDLQAPMMVLQAVAHGTSVIEETVFENRMLHAAELQKMGAHIEVHYTKAIIIGVKKLYGTDVKATDIRASCALLLAGLIAEGQTRMSGLAHFRRGYEQLDQKMGRLGAFVKVRESAVSRHIEPLSTEKTAF